MKIIKKIWNKIDKVLSLGFIAIIGIICTLITWGHSPDERVSFSYYSFMWMMLGIVVFFVIFYSILKYASERNMNKSKVLLPTVKKIVIKENNITFILSPSELYYQNMMVSVFYDEGEETSMALSLGVGYIETINEKGYIQVKFYSIHQDETVNKIFEKIKNENVKYSNIKIKPSVSYNDLEESR